jgi:hypothetical protein
MREFEVGPVDGGRTESILHQSISRLSGRKEIGIWFAEFRRSSFPSETSSGTRREVVAKVVGRRG